MEYIKEKIPALLGIIIFIALCGIAYYFAFVESKTYYSQIDNTKIEKIGVKEYNYTLTAYDEKGSSKEIEFKTNRELRDTAFLEFEVMLSRGVINWQEVSYEELPNEVKNKYNPVED